MVKLPIKKSIYEVLILMNNITYVVCFTIIISITSFKSSIFSNSFLIIAAVLQVFFSLVLILIYVCNKEAKMSTYTLGYLILGVTSGILLLLLGTL